MQAEDKDLLKKFLYGHCTPEENRKAQELLKQPGTQAVMEELTLQEWNEPASPDETLNAVMGDWKEKLHKRIVLGEPEMEEKQQISKPVKRLVFLRYAAVWAGLLLLSSVIIWQLRKTGHTESISLIEKSNTKGQPVKYTLPDSSEVYLGAGSHISYPVQFAGNKREINLQGEAFFQVKHNAAQPFIIHTGEIQTQVLGTSFKVKAFNGQSLVVAVATGKVGVSHIAEQSTTLALLTPGQKVTWNMKTGKAVQGSVDVYSLEQWKSGDMVFEDQPMEQIATELQRRFGIKIEFMDKAVTNNQVSGTFPSNKSVNKIMTTLSMAGKFRYETKDNKSFKIYKTD